MTIELDNKNNEIRIMDKILLEDSDSQELRDFKVLIHGLESRLTLIKLFSHEYEGDSNSVLDEYNEINNDAKDNCEKAEKAYESLCKDDLKKLNDFCFNIDTFKYVLKDIKERVIEVQIKIDAAYEANSGIQITKKVDRNDELDKIIEALTEAKTAIMSTDLDALVKNPSELFIFIDELQKKIKESEDNCNGLWSEIYKFSQFIGYEFNKSEKDKHDYILKEMDFVYKLGKSFQEHLNMLRDTLKTALNKYKESILDK